MGSTGEEPMSIAGDREGQIDSTRLIFPGLAGLYQGIAPYSYAIIRFCAGAILIYHGYGKLFGGNIAGVAEHVVTPLGLPMPMAWAYFLGGLEFFGGAALAVGFLTRPIALMLTFCGVLLGTGNCEGFAPIATYLKLIRFTYADFSPMRL